MTDKYPTIYIESIEIFFFFFHLILFLYLFRCPSIFHSKLPPPHSLSLCPLSVPLSFVIILLSFLLLSPTCLTTSISLVSVILSISVLLCLPTARLPILCHFAMSPSVGTVPLYLSTSSFYHLFIFLASTSVDSLTSCYRHSLSLSCLSLFPAVLQKCLDSMLHKLEKWKKTHNRIRTSVCRNSLAGKILIILILC